MSEIIHAFMRRQPGFDIGAPEAPPRKANRSTLRTGAIVAGGAGLAYGGVKVGRAASAVKKAAVAAEAASHKHAAAMESAGKVAGGVSKAGQKLKKLFRFEKREKVQPKKAVKKSLRKVVAFGAPTVSKDRYVKSIHEKDSDRAGSHYVRSAGAGALLGLGLRKGGTRKLAALKGAVAGISAQAVTRGVSSTTKDVYGDRTPGGKFLDKLPAAGLLAGGIAVGVPRLRKKFPKAAARITKFSRREALMHGAALAGGIAVADGVTGAIRPGKDTRREAATEGLKRGAIYGGALAVSEPAIMAALQRAGWKGKRRPGLVKLTVAEAEKRGYICLNRNGAVIAFRGRQQLFTDDNPGNPSQYADPIKGASGEQRVYTRDEKGNKNPEVPTFRHAQVLKAAYNKGRDIHKWGGRSARVTSDVGDVIRGKKKVDERGRPLKREWEKSYFRNAVGGAVAGAALLAHHRAYRDHPKYRANVKHYRKKFRDTVNNAVPGAFNNLSARGRTFVFARGPQGRLIAFDYSAADWDVRDQRGRSARVFAPGARARDRREKHWHEKTSNMKKLAVVGAVLAAAGGGAAGFKIGRTRGVKIGRQATSMKAAAARKARAAKVAADVATGAAAEDAAIKRMNKRPPVND
ncbi:MAG: hypothetical protein QOE70_4025 [Chthoniobacter sp.]|jgi:hypothetical protein|nr:hypothetical protein [Chthoniobacter sp.]